MISSKVKGIFRVSLSNLISLGLSMLTSFILPLYISIEQYGYWQLFILYVGYVGFFVLGFNDGVQLNYATYTYNDYTASIFRSFKKFLLVLTGCESLFLIFIAIVLFKNHEPDIYISILVILNIIPTALIGLFIYMNQSTLRFKEYAWCNIVDKIVFAIMMIILLCFKMKNSLLYMIAYTISRYCVLIYCYLSSKEVFTSKLLEFKSIRKDIYRNFKTGFPLMIAIILGGPTIIVSSRFLIENKFGIDSFSSYSFALHTLIIAGQFITSVSTVFYPILKRCNRTELPKMYNSFDKISTIAGIILLITYYPAAMIVYNFYSSYESILDYMYIIYPLFIYQCKVNVLVTNMYKVNDAPTKLIVVNIIGIFLNILFITIAYIIFNTVISIAIATVISYILWYYILQLHTYKIENWVIKFSVFADLPIFAFFIFLNHLLIGNYSIMIWLLYSGICYVSVCLLLGITFRRNLYHVMLEFKKLMRD